MKWCGMIAAAMGMAVGALTCVPASAWHRGQVDSLAVLPNGTSGQPTSAEGLTVGPDGNIYLTSFGFNSAGAVTGNATLFVVSPQGSLIREVAIANSSPHELGLGFNPVNGFLLVLDFGGGQVLHVDPQTGESSVFMVPPVGDSGLNGVTFDKLGNTYVTDSFNGIIWKTGPYGGTPTVWSNDPLLSPGTGLNPPFGANGIEFNKAGTIAFVANTAFHQIIQIPVNADGSAGAASIFNTGINAPDGIAIDANDNLWICANQEDDVIVLDTTGKVIAKLGDFGGVNKQGLVQGFAFPASPAFSPDGKWLYVSNASLYLPFSGAGEAVDSPWMLQIQHYNVARIPAVIPPVGN